jgi:hypothetical protein
MNIKIKTTKSTYKTGPNAGKQTITRTLTSTDVGYSLNVVKTIGTKTYAVVFSSAAVIEGLRLDQALLGARVVMTECPLPKIDDMRECVQFARHT